MGLNLNIYTGTKKTYIIKINRREMCGTYLEVCCSASSQNLSNSDTTLPLTTLPEYCAKLSQHAAAVH